jgi:hypothetical protein
MRATIVLSAALVVCASFTAAEAAEIAVIESTSARYVAGQTLDAAVPITLAAGESLTIVTEDARLIRIEGPHSGPAVGPAPDPSAVRRALTQLIVEERPAVGGIGGVRAGEFEPQGADTRSDPWLLHAERSGDQCVLGGASIGVWRENASDAFVTEVSISLAESSTQIRWNAGEQRAAWPAQTAPVDDAVYLLRPSGSLRSVPIRLHLLAPDLADSGLATAAWLAAKGCIEQARVLLRGSPEPQ